MAQIIKFFGWLLMGLVLVVLILGHIVMVILYDFNYLLDTLWPKDPAASSSMWYTLASMGPGAGLWLIGFAVEQYDKYKAKKEVLHDQASEDAEDAPLSR